MKKGQMLRIAGVIGLSGLIVVFIGNGCSQEFVTSEMNSSQMASTGGSGSGGSGGSGSSSASGADSGITVIPGAKTASLVGASQVLNHLTSCAGVVRPSDPTVAMYNTKKGSISEYGAANTITSPMMMAITSIAGEVCDDLIDQEIASGGRIFQGINLQANAIPSSNLLGDAISRMALSCWERYDTSSERQMILNSILTTVGATEAQAARKASLMLCTSMLSSLDSLLN